MTRIYYTLSKENPNYVYVNIYNIIDYRFKMHFRNRVFFDPENSLDLLNKILEKFNLFNEIFKIL